jgi:hypothetical protein
MDSHLVSLKLLHLSSFSTPVNRPLTRRLLTQKRTGSPTNMLPTSPSTLSIRSDELPT